MSKEGKKGHGNLTLYIIISIVLAILTALILPALMGVEKEQTTLSIFLKESESVGKFSCGH